MENIRAKHLIEDRHILPFNHPNHFTLFSGVFIITHTLIINIANTGKHYIIMSRHLPCGKFTTCSQFCQIVPGISCSTTPMWRGQVEPSNMILSTDWCVCEHVQKLHWQDFEFVYNICYEIPCKLNEFHARLIMWRFVTSGGKHAGCGWVNGRVYSGEARRVPQVVCNLKLW
jgi:hypothetical protein